MNWNNFIIPARLQPSSGCHCNYTFFIFISTFFRQSLFFFSRFSTAAHSSFTLSVRYLHGAIKTLSTAPHSSLNIQGNSGAAAWFAFLIVDGSRSFRKLLLYISHKAASKITIIALVLRGTACNLSNFYRVLSFDFHYKSLEILVGMPEVESMHTSYDKEWNSFIAFDKIIFL